MYTPIKEAILQSVSRYAASGSSSSDSSTWRPDSRITEQQQQQQQQNSASNISLTGKQQLLVKVLAGVISGGVAATICSPTELIKVGGLVHL
jgi:hypothetical protein